MVRAGLQTLRTEALSKMRPEMATVRRLVVETVAVIVVAADHRREARGRDRRCQATTSVSLLNMGGSGGEGGVGSGMGKALPEIKALCVKLVYAAVQPPKRHPF